MTELTAVILAAGEGKRMKSTHSKVVHKILGKELIRWVYDAALKAGVGDCILVIGHRAEEVRECMGDDVKYVMQEQQLGTGHAVMQAVPHLEGRKGTVMVMCGDMPLISPETIRNAYETHISENNAVTILTADFEDPSGYGRIVRDSSGKVVKIVEEKDAEPEEKNIREINSALYCFETELLIDALTGIGSNNSQKEYYLTDTIEILITKGKRVGTFKIPNNYEIMGINDRVQLSRASDIMRRIIAEGHMREGVTIIHPESVYIDSDVRIGMDTVIYPGTILEGDTIIEPDCIIGPDTRIVASKVQRAAEIQYSVVLRSSIGELSHVGPFAYVRPGSVIGKGTKIGDFVEVKNSTVGDHTKVSHLSYIGDCDVGENVNVGCGTVVVNYDGRKKHRTRIGDNAFVGCNANLISPVEIEDNAYIAAGSTITDDVPENALAIARARQENKEGWVLKKRLNRSKKNS